MSNNMPNTCCNRVLQSINAMVVTLEFAVDKTVIRRYDVDQENFKEAIYMLTPPHLRETGLPFDNENILYSKKYILKFWEFFFIQEEPESLAYTGRFLDSLTVTNYKGNYSIRTVKKRSLPNDPLNTALAKIFRR